MDGTVADKKIEHVDPKDDAANENRNTALTRVEDKPIGQGSQVAPIIPQDTGEIARYANFVWSNGMAPKSFKGPGQLSIAIMAGYERGKPPMWALKNLCVINNIPCVYGDGATGLIWESGLLESFKERWDAETETAHCVVKRKGMPDPVERSFSSAQAARAGLTKKDTYKSYIERMCAWRARQWCFRDAFADVLDGLALAEEVASATPGYAVTLHTDGSAQIEDQRERIDNALSDEGVPDVDGDDSDIEEAEVVEVEADEVSDGEPDVDDVTDDEPDVDEEPDYEAKLAALKTAVADANKLGDLEPIAEEHAIADWPKDWNRKAVAWLKKAEAELKK